MCVCVFKCPREKICLTSFASVGMKKKRQIMVRGWGQGVARVKVGQGHGGESG